MIVENVPSSNVSPLPVTKIIVELEAEPYKSLNVIIRFVISVDLGIVSVIGEGRESSIVTVV
jgi:hypothetical protein